MSDFQNFCVYVLLLTQRIIICHVPYEFLMFEIHYMILDHPNPVWPDHDLLSIFLTQLFKFFLLDFCKEVMTVSGAPSSCLFDNETNICGTYRQISMDFALIKVARIYGHFEKCTLGSQINVPVRLLIFEDFSHQYALIPASTFIILSNDFNLR